MYSQQFKGWFSPPADGNYVFYASCDDSCKVYLSTSNMTTTDQTEIINVSSFVGFRQITNGMTKSSPQSLLKGNYYYISAYHVQKDGGNHFTVHVKTPIELSTPV